jgi:hypothetical protein
VSSKRRMLATIGTVAAVGLAMASVGGAFAQSDAATGTSDEALVERLGDLEGELPADVPPLAVTLSPDVTWGELAGDAGSVRAVLDTVEPALRQLFIDADEAAGPPENATSPTAAAVAEVARGWLDVWTGSASLATAETNDLAFPVDTADADGVSTGADELRGEIEIGLELILLGQERLLSGYTSLQELGIATPATQALFDARASAMLVYDEDVRPLVALLLPEPSPTLLVPVERFVTDAPGVQPRATSMTVVCIDRQAYEDAGGVVTEETLEELTAAQVDRADCPGLPEDVQGDADAIG